ncbi:MAG: InlB B-repeat-containing protein [Candidatus Methanomethylophilaceae archaeon]|nr:InlB B-repeat-containing protein [Candidatus Methanomethylophilaceae archaeon]
MTALLLLAVALAFVTVSVTDAASASEDYDQYIVYEDPEGNNASATIGYYGIAATEYNPEYWSNTGYVGNRADWTGPMGEPVTVNGFTVTIKSLGKKDNTYTINFPSNHYVLSATHNGNAITGADIGDHFIRYKQSVGSDYKSNTPDILTVTFADISITPQKVFGGWLNDKDELVLPGDVVDKETTILKAKWITPDIFVQSADWIDWFLMRNKDGGMPTTTEVSVVSAYANLGFVSKKTGDSGYHNYNDKDGKMGVLAFGELQTIDGHPNSQYIKLTNSSYNYPVRYNYVIRGDERTDSDMFGTIYHLTNERTKEGIFYGSFGELTTYPKAFTAGTYMTPDDGNYLKPTLKFNNNGVKTGHLGGNVIIDKVILDAEAPSTHGDSTNSALLADGHILIMGANLDTIVKSNNSKIEGGLIQINGGSYDRNITDPVDIPGSDTDNKSIVFGDGQEHDLQVKLGTYVIIHSGIYANIVAGSQGGNDIGTPDEPLSTYLVLKGGSTADTVAGGLGGAKGTIYGGDDSGVDTGGTFVYLINHFTAGDDYEDKKFKDSKQYGRDRYGISQSSIVEGGNSGGTVGGAINPSNIRGSTHVFVSGTSSVWDVQAGGRSGNTHADSTYLEITGKATVRHIACGTITDGSALSNNCVDHVHMYIGDKSVVASIYGAGYDTTFYPKGMSMTGGSISIVVAGGKIGNVYGGGYRGSVGNEADSSKFAITIDIQGGEILGDVYGGGSGGLDKIKHNKDGTFSQPGYDNYFKTMGKSYVYGNINVTIADAVVHGNVYGGGMSVPKLLSYSAGTNLSNFADELKDNKLEGVAIVKGDVEVHINEGAEVLGSVFGGGRGIEYNYSNGKWDLGNYTEMTVVDVTKLNADNPFTTIPWYTNSTGGYTYVYDTSYLTYDSNNKVTGGNYLEFAKVIGNTAVFIDGGSVTKDVYGGGAQGKVAGSTAVEMHGGYVGGNVFGGGLGHADIVSVTGTRGAYITGSSRIKGSVYGSSSKGDDGPKATFHIRESTTDSSTEYFTDSTVVIEDAEINGSVFGGGFLGKTYGSTYVYLGHGFVRNADGTYNIGDDGAEDKRIKVGSIYAGGNVSSSPDEDSKAATSFGAPLVQGHGTVHVHGNGDASGVSISGSIMGSGNACETGMSTEIEIEELNNDSTMTGIHRADEVTIYQSFLNITGRSTVTDNKTASLYMIGTLTLQYDTTLKILHPADDVHALNSFNKNGNPTTPGSPSNSIVFTGGSTFYVRNIATDAMGVVNGNIIMSVEGQSSYGAYVMCRPDSPGAFVITKDGTFSSANYTEFDSETRCWFIGGTEKKVVTMNLTAAETRALVSTGQISVDIMKMYNDTTMEYVGGSFTSLGSDGINDYKLVKPGLQGGVLPATNEFGLIITDGGTLKPRNTETFADFGNVKGIYFNEEQNTSVKFDSGKNAGTYRLNLMFTGAPSNNAAYLGYVVLGFREVTEVIDEGSTYTVPANYIEVRADLYVMPSGSSTAFGIDYTVKVKTEYSSGKNAGYSDVLFPKTESMAELQLTGVEGDFPAGSSVIVSAIANQDNTTGWMISNVIRLNNANDNLNESLGVLLGSSVATIRYYVEYTDEAPTGVKLIFALKIDGQEDKPSTITLVIQDKGKVNVTFKNLQSGADPEKTEQYYYGTKLSKSQCPDAGTGFVGWYLDKAYTSPYNHEAPLTKDLTLYARFMYTVTFDNMDGSSSKLYLSQTANGTRIAENLMPVLGKEGYEFGGWFTGKDYVYQWNPTSDLVTGDMTLYAKWTGVSVKVNFYYEKYNESTQKMEWVQLETDETYHDYVMKIVKQIVNGVETDVPVYPSVKIGSSFDVNDPVQKKNILQYAESFVMEKMGDDKRFIRWQAYPANDTVNGTPFSVYHDTILEKWMVNLNTIEEKSGMPVIKLYAITSTISIKVIMDKTNWDETVKISDESAIVSPPSTFYVYPSGIGSSSDIEYIDDGRGNYYRIDKNVLVSFNEVIEHHETIITPEGEVDVVTEEVVLRYLDKFFNVWKQENNAYVLVRSTVYTMDQDIETKYEVNAEDNYPDGCYYKDKYGNCYDLQNEQKPSDPENDQYICKTGSSDKYYEFTYILNDATLSGHRLVSWHNTKISSAEALHPRPGAERTLKVFFNVDEASVVVVKTVLEATDAKGNPIIIVLDDGEGVHTLNDTQHDYEITYRAEWTPLDYVVNISLSSNGSVDAFITGSDGVRKHISGTSVVAHYGDLIELSYTPLTAHYQFSKWSLSGEYEIEDPNSSSTTMMVLGNCNISVNDIGDRAVRLNMIFDADQITAEELAKTKVFLHSKEFDNEYYEMDYDSSITGLGYKTFKNYVPLGNYEVCVRYGTSADYDEYKMLGDVNISLDGTAVFTYYIISASIMDEIEVTTKEGKKTYHSYFPEGSVLRLTKYVGALDTLIFGQSQDLIINNPDGKLPAVEITLAAGYKYLTFEGFPDIVEGEEIFILNEKYNYHTGKTDTGDTPSNPDGTVTLQFHLNWTKYDKPADIIVQMDVLKYDVNYKVGDEVKTAEIAFGERFLPKVPSFDLPVGYSLGGWYFDEQFTHQVIGKDTLDNSLIGQAKSEEGLTLYGNVIQGVTKNIMIDIEAKNIDDPGYTSLIQMVVPMLKQNDGSYTFNFMIQSIPGLHYSLAETPQGFSVTQPDVEHLLITAESEASWIVPMPTVVFKYDRDSVSISVTNDASQIESGAWEPGKTAVFGEEVPFPIMKKNENGDEISGWTSSPAGANIYQRDGLYYYKVGAMDPGTISFTAVYPPKSLTVTFITPIGSFATGGDIKRMVQNVDEGQKVSEPNIIRDSSVYTDYVFYDGDAEFDFDTQITENKTLIAEWTVASYDLKYKSDGHASVGVSTNKESVKDGDWTKYDMGYHYEVVFTIIPEAGYDLDVDATLQASGLTELDIGTPEKLSNNKGYTWTFFITKNISLDVKTRESSANIHFIINGSKVTNVVVKDFINPDITYPGGKNIPVYTTVTFEDYNGQPWYSGPDMEDILPYKTVDDKRVYVLTVDDDMSVYSVSNIYHIYYYDHAGDERRQDIDTTQAGDHATLYSDIPGYDDQHIFVGWAVMDVDGNKVYTYEPGATITLDTHTPTWIELHAFYLKAESVEYIFDDVKHYSSVSNDDSKQLWGDFTPRVRYAEIPMDKTNYNTIGNGDPSAVSFKEVGAHDVYFFGDIRYNDHGIQTIRYYISGSFTVKILEKNLVTFVSDGATVEQRRVSDGVTIGAAPIVSKTGYELDGWYRSDDTKFNFDTDTVYSNTVLTAKWIKLYTVTFDYDNGSESTSVPVKEGSLVERPDDPVKEGYDFLGWYDGETLFDFTQGIAKNTTLKAKWIKLYTVTFDTDGGTEIEPKTVREGATVDRPDDPTKSVDYIFSGWYVGEVSFSFTTPIYADTILTAHWTEKQKYEVKFYSQVGGGQPELRETVAVTEGQKVSAPEQPEGDPRLTFLGWYEFEIVDEKVVIGAKYDFDTVVERDYKLIANWEPFVYTIKFDLKGGSGTVEDRHEAVFGGPIILPTEGISKAGCRLVGWSLTDGGEVLAGNVLTRPLPVHEDKEMTLYAIWIEQYTVTIDPDNGDPQTQNVYDRGTIIEDPGKPEKENYKFGGWYDGDTPFDFTQGITKTVTIKARWLELHTVTIDPDNGSQVQTIKVAHGETFAQPEDPTKQSTETTDFKFSGWYLNDATYNFNAPVMSDITVKAGWIERLAPTVNYYGLQGGTTPTFMHSDVVHSGQTVVKPEGYPPAQRGLDFIGWYTYTYENEILTIGELYVFGSTLSEDLNLITQWERKEYSITLDDNYEGGSSSSMTATAFAPKPIVYQPTREGYELAGWSLTKGGDAVFTDSVSFPVADNPKQDVVTVTIYAVWLKLHTVTFNTDGGTQVAPQKVPDGGRAVRPADPTKSEEYVFSGWYVGDVSYSFTSEVHSDIVITAHWTEKLKYQVTFYSQVGGGTPELRETKSVIEGGKVEVPPQPAGDPRLSFLGWYEFTIVDDHVVIGNKYDFDTEVGRDYQLIANWQPYIYTIKFDLKGGSESVEEMHEATFGEPIALPTEGISKEGCRFVGWSLTDGGEILAGDRLERPLPVHENKEMTLYAVWILQHEVTFSTSETVHWVVLVDHDSKVSTPQEPTQEGYNFRGWFIGTGEEEHQYDFNTSVTADISLHAKWEAKRPNVVSYYSLQSDGIPRQVTSVQVAYNEVVKDPGSPLAQRGLNFLGWYEFTFAQDGSPIIGEKYAFGDHTTRDLNLITNWERKVYTVHFELPEPTRGMSDLTVTAYSGPTVFDSSSATKEGFRLLGWSLNDGGDVQFTDRIAFPLESGEDNTYVRLYPVWMQQHAVSFDPTNGGTVTVQNIDTGGYAVRPDDPSWDNHRFAGWFLETAEEPFDFGTQITSDITLTARWIQIFTVTFVVDDSVFTTQNVEDGALATKPVQDPSKGEYRFVYWYENDEDVEFDFLQTAIGSNTVLKAKWAEKNTYLVRFYGQYGGVPDLKNSMIVFEGSRISQPADPPEQERMTFLGWYVFEFKDDGSADIKYKYDFNTEVAQDYNIIANWQPDVYTIKFNPNGGTGSISDMHESIYGPPIVIPGNHPTREGYAFFGWSTTPEGDVEYTNVIPRPLPVYEDKIMTLYAVWGEGFTVTFDSDGGSHVDSQTVIKNTKAEKPADPTKEHNRFLGWYLGEATEPFDFDTPITADITLTAKWLPSYLVKFDSQGGSSVESQYVEPGSKAVKPKDPTKTGNKFLGWFLGAAEEPFDFDTPITSDITLTAKWLQLYVVAFDTAGGSVIPAQYVEPGAKAVKPADPTRSGYEFVGWYYNESPFDFDSPITADITIVAKWYSDKPTPTPDPSERIIDKDTEVIVNPDGSTTKIETETVMERDGSITKSVKETTVEEDGSTVTKQESTHTDRYGNVTKEALDSVVMTDREGNTIESVMKTKTEADSSSRTEVETTVRNAGGWITDTEVIITNTDASGKEETIVITGDYERIEAVVPGTDLASLREAESVIQKIAPREATIVFETEGDIVIPIDYLREASLQSFGIEVQNSSTLQSVEITNQVVQKLSKHGQDAVFSVKVVQSKDLSEMQKAVIRDNYAMTLVVTVGDTVIHELGGEARIAVLCDQPYDHVYYVSDNGAIEEIECEYHADTKTLEFTLTHFSVYTLTVGPLDYVVDGEDLTIIVLAALIALVMVGIAVLVIKKR